MPMIPDPSGSGMMKVGKKRARTYYAAQDQANLNRQAQAQSMVNQVGPGGETVNYAVDPTKKPGEPGYYTATTTLSPEQQALQAKQNALSNQYADVAGAQLQNVSGTMSQPFSLGEFDPQAGRGQEIYNLQKSFLDDRFAQERQNQEAWLRDRGIPYSADPNSAYQQQMKNFELQKNQAYNDLAARSDQQAFNQTMAGRQNYSQEALTQRNQPLQELSALRTGAPVSQPQFVNAPGVQAPDALGFYGQQVAGANAAQQAKTGALYGAIGSGVGTAAGLAASSDRRLKEDITRVGKLDDGTKVYTYRYKGSPMMQMGVMAQDIEGRHPEAVADTSDGYKAVYYGKIARAMRKN